MHWIILIVAGFCEVGFAFCLGKDKGCFVCVSAPGLKYMVCKLDYAVFVCTLYAEY